MPDSPDPTLDSDAATLPLSGPRPTLSAGNNIDLPLPEELTKLLPPGAYEVTRFLGAGGMGAVYQGMQVRLKRPVAIKIMRRDMGRDQDFEARFEREAQAMAKLNHPNIVSVIDYGEAGADYLYIVMELIDGADMMDVIRGGQMTQEMALSLLPQICDALQFAHDHGIVHRDIKPSNIMLTRDGRIKMADFGLAKHFDAESSFRTQTGTGMGTPDYAAPEQFSPNSPIDHRADIYALGVMIYQMITGQLPRGVWKPPSQRAEVAPQWDAIVSRAMQSDPIDRYQQASEVKTAVNTIPLSGKDGSAGTLVRPAASGGTATKNDEADKSVRAPVKSRAPLFIGLITGAVVIAIGAFFALKKPTETSPPTPSTRVVTSSPPVAEPWVRVWNSPEGLSNAVTLVDGWVVSKTGGTTLGGTLLYPMQWHDSAIRSEWKWSGGPSSGSIGGHISIRESGKHRYKLSRNKKAVLLHRTDDDNATVLLQEHPVGEPKEGETFTLELRAVGTTLTAKLDGKEIIRVKDDKLTTGGPAVYVFEKGGMRNIEVLNLDKPTVAVVSPSPSPQVSKSSAPEPSAIKLWDAPDRIPPGEGIAWEDGALRVGTFPASYNASKSSSGAILRAAVRFSSGAEGAQINIRQGKGLSADDRSYYTLDVLPKFRLITLKIVNGKRESTELQRWKVPEDYQGDKWASLELQTLAGELTATFDGKVLGTVRDSTLTEFTGFTLWAKPLAYFRDIEYLPLDKMAVSTSPGLPISNSSSPAPAAIKLWDTAEKLPKSGGASWEEGAVRLADGFPLVSQLPLVSDQILRAKVRMNADAINPSIGVRSIKGADGRVSNYSLAISSDRRTLNLIALVENQVKPLLKGTLSRNYEPDEWVALELQIRGDELTASAEGRVIGKVTDSSVKGSGTVQIIAKANGYFREIEYVPLDKAEVSLPSSPAPTAIKLWDSSEKLDDPRAEWKDGAVHLPDNAGLYARPLSRDAIIRASIRMNLDAGGPQVQLRHLGDRAYRLAINPKDNYVVLARSYTDKQVSLRQWPLPRHYREDEWVRLELRAVGDQLTAVADGKELGTMTDSEFSQPGAAAIFATNGYFRDIEYVPLDKQPSVSPSPTLPVSKSSDPKFPPGHWVKLFTKPEDLPADLRKPDSGVKWEDGWIKAEGSYHLVSLPESLAHNYGIRGHIRRRMTSNSSTLTEIKVRFSKPSSNQVDVSQYTLAMLPGGDLLSKRWSKGVSQNVAVRSTTKPVQAGDEYTLEFAAVGNQLVGRLNSDSLIFAKDDSLPQGQGGLILTEDIRDIEVINLDGLSEAEALRLLGVDERGNDLRGKAGAASAAEPWDPKVSRAAAELALTKSNSVIVEQNGQTLSIAHSKPLPPGDFRFMGFIMGTFGPTQPYDDLAKGTTAAELRAMLAAVELERVNVKSVRVLDDEICRIMASKPGLKDAGFQGAGMTDELLRHFSEATLLEKLDLSQCFTVTNSGFAHLSKLQRLRSLGLEDTKVTAQGVAALKSADQLESLSMKWNGDPDAVAVASACPNLKRLALTCSLSPEGLRQIAGLKNLVSLRLAGSTLTTAHLTVLAKAPSLSELTLDKCVIPDSTALDAALKQMPMLKKVTINGVARTLPVSQSSDKFPPGQWVKVTELSPDLQKPERGKFEEGWFKSANLSVNNYYDTGLVGRNAGIRATARIPSGTSIMGAIALQLRRSTAAGSYQFMQDLNGMTISHLAGKERTNLASRDKVTVVNDMDVKLAFAAVGGRLVGWVNDKLVVTTEDSREANGFIGASFRCWIRDVEVINLGGLSDAEALHLLGVDEQGNDLRGKTGTAAASATPTPVWRDALAEAPLKKVIATADHTDKGYLLPPGNHWEFPAQPVRAGAIRVLAVTEAGSPNHLSLNFGLPGTRDHYQVFFRRKLNECGLAYLKEGLPERRLALKKGVNLADGQPHELLLARIADQFYFLLNGEVILQAAEPDPTARYLTLNCFGDTHARVQKVEYLSLDGVSETEALKMAGISAVSPTPSLPHSKSSAAKATKDAPFINTLGMKFVPVPITGGPTDKQRVLFSVWETRVQDYEAFAKETKREWPKPDFEQGPTHPAVMVSWDRAQRFCEWLTERERKAGKLGVNECYRLPSDHEWSCAAGIGDREDATMQPSDMTGKLPELYSWGQTWPPSSGAGNYAGEEMTPLKAADKGGISKDTLKGYHDGYAKTAPVGSFSPNELGLYDLSGNVLEWCEDWFDVMQKDHVKRGGCFNNGNQGNLKLSGRFHGTPDGLYDFSGFRCVLEVTNSKL